MFSFFFFGRVKESFLTTSHANTPLVVPEKIRREERAGAIVRSYTLNHILIKTKKRKRKPMKFHRVWLKKNAQKGKQRKKQLTVKKSLIGVETQNLKTIVSVIVDCSTNF